MDTKTGVGDMLGMAAFTLALSIAVLAVLAGLIRLVF